MRNLLLFTVYLLPISFCFGQTKKLQPGEPKIKKTIIGFLNWYKLEERDTARRDYALVKGGYPDTSTKERIDKNGVEKYLDKFRKSNFVSETFINDLRAYFMSIDKFLEIRPKFTDMVKIPGMDIDFVLQTYEPEAILDHINQSRITKIDIIYNKALVGLHISKHVDMIFILTKWKNNWLIDYVGDDATDQKSFFRQ